MNKTHSLVLDVGTTGVKAFVFDEKLRVAAKSYQKLSKQTPKRGWVEQDPKEILAKSVAAIREAVNESKVSLILLAGLGITNQRETTILWDKKTGRPVYPAIVWEDTRTQKRAYQIAKTQGGKIRFATGLFPDPYFSATKIEWILKNVPSASKLREKKRLAFGTVDSWILWNLSKEKTHATDYTNASRTLLFNIRRLEWDKKLLDLFFVPAEILPEVRPSRSLFGHLRSNILDVPLPITAICGDQQSSMYAAGIIPGTTKITYGTGTFAMQSLGRHFVLKEPFFTTLIPNRSRPAYALEAKIDCCGGKVDRLLASRRNLDPTIGALARKADELIRRLPRKPRRIIVDGGLTQAKNLPAIQSRISKIPVKRQSIFDGTALGIAKLMRE